MVSVLNKVEVYKNSSLLKILLSPSLYPKTLIINLIKDTLRGNINYHEYTKAVKVIEGKSLLMKFNLLRADLLVHQQMTIVAASILAEDALVSNERFNQFNDMWSIFATELANLETLYNFIKKANQQFNEVEDLNPIEVTEINLKRKETPFYKGNGYMGRNKTRTASASYVTPQYTVRLGKGARIRLGNVRVARHTEEVFVTDIRGIVVITDSRVIVSGDSTKTFTFNSIAKVEATDDGFTIHRNNGQVLFFVTGDVVAGRILKKVLDLNT